MCTRLSDSGGEWSSPEASVISPKQPHLSLPRYEHRPFGLPICLTLLFEFTHVEIRPPRDPLLSAQPLELSPA